MVAPLVRHAYWYISKAHYYLAKPFVHAYPRPFRTNSSDPQFLVALRNDPLEGNEIPLTWLGALYAWNRKIEWNASAKVIASAMKEAVTERVAIWETVRENFMQAFPEYDGTDNSQNAQGLSVAMDPSNNPGGEGVP